MNVKERLGVIDILRLISVFIIFLFHSHIHITCDYGILTPFINMGAIFMTAFFMISGFSLHYVNINRLDSNNTSEILKFYKKRIISIMPIYWFMVIIYPIWDVIVNKKSLTDNIILLPVEIFGVQDTYHSLFEFTHNGGTWFVSCILFCYLVFPFIFKIINEISIKARAILVLVLVFFLLYAPFLARYLKVENVYSNIFYRMLEFVIGMLFCLIWIENKDKQWYKKIANWWTFIISFLVLVIAVSVFANMGILVGNYMAYSIIGLPCFSILIFVGAGIYTPHINASKLIKYLVEISYVFFFAQFFTWKVTLKLLMIIGIDNNLTRIFVSLTICIMISIGMHELIEKPLKKRLNKKL